MIDRFVSIRKYPQERTLHRHDYHQIVFPHIGALELEIEGHGGRVEFGVGAFIAAGATHAFLARGQNGFLVIDIPVHHDRSERLVGLFQKEAFFPIEKPIRGLLEYASATFEREDLSKSVLGNL